MNAHRLRSSQPLWLAISIVKHRVGEPARISAIHVRLIGAGLIGGASSRVTNPISGRAGLLDLCSSELRLAGGTRCHSGRIAPHKSGRTCHTGHGGLAVPHLTMRSRVATKSAIGGIDQTERESEPVVPVVGNRITLCVV